MSLDTHYAEMVVNHYERLFKEGMQRLWWIKKMRKENLSIQDVKVTKDIGLTADPFTLSGLQNEIRRNILNIADDTTFTNYLHYLIKINWTLKENASKYRRSYEPIENLQEDKEWPSIDFGLSTASYNSEEELLGHCKYLLNAPSIHSLHIYFMILEEFRYDLDVWKEHIANRVSPPTREQVEMLLGKRNGEPATQDATETVPSPIRKMKWLGSPAQFGFIVDLLIQGGYLERPTSSFERDAAFFLGHFEIEGAKSTIVKELSETSNSLAPVNRKKITIPHINKLG